MVYGIVTNTNDRGGCPPPSLPQKVFITAVESTVCKMFLFSRFDDHSDRDSASISTGPRRVGRSLSLLAAYAPFTTRPTALQPHPVSIAGIPGIRRRPASRRRPSTSTRHRRYELVRPHTVDADVIHRRQNDVIIGRRCYGR